MMMWLAGLLLLALLTLGLLVLWVLEKRRHAKGGNASGQVFLAVPLLVLVLTVAGYLLIGQNPHSSEWLQQRADYREVAQQILAGAAPEQVARDVPAGALVRVLQSELVRAPTAQGWFILGSLYDQLGAPEQAQFAAEKVKHMAPDNVEGRLLLARALIAGAEGALTPAAEAELAWVTERYPNHDSAWMMQAMAAERAGRLALAEQAWQALLARHGEGETGALLRRGLAGVQTQLARAEHFKDIEITVNADDLPAGGTLFVFVRERGSAGQPLASRPQLVRQFPATVTVQHEHWLQRYPDKGADLVVGARYTPAPGASVDQAAFRSQLRPLTLPQSEPVSLQLGAGR